MQAVCANDVLRRFTSEAEETIATQGREIRDLRKGLSQLRRLREDERRQTAADADQALLTAVDSVRSVLRQAVAAGHATASNRSRRPVCPVPRAEDRRAAGVAHAGGEDGRKDVAGERGSVGLIERVEQKVLEMQREWETEKATLVRDKEEVEV
jgi:hypothetical protein